MPRPRDEFDDDGISVLDRIPLRFFAKILGGVAVVGIVGYAVVAFWPQGDRVSAAGPVPIIHADTAEWKEAPKDPGGMAVPNANSTIFETLRGADDTKPRVENLLDDPEKPMKKDDALPTEMAAKTEPLTDVRLEKTGEDPVQSKDESVKPDENKVVQTDEAPVKSEQSVAPQKSDIIQELKNEAGVPKTEPAPSVASSPDQDSKKDEKPKPKATGSTYIQLAAVKSDAEAKTQWAKLKSKYSGLSDLTLRVQRADLGDKGIFYRIQAGPTSQENAASLCSKIKSQNGACVVLK